jgi:histidyl-tRNA synthetase
VELARAEGVDGAEPAADVFLIAAGDAPRRRGFELAERLRDRLPGLRLSIGSPAAGFKAQLRRADKSGARYALILGDAEIAADRIGVKPLREDRPQELMTLDDCVRLLGAAPRSA